MIAFRQTDRHQGPGCCLTLPWSTCAMMAMLRMSSRATVLACGSLWSHSNVSWARRGLIWCFIARSDARTSSLPPLYLGGRLHRGGHHARAATHRRRAASSCRSARALLHVCITIHRAGISRVRFESAIRGRLPPHHPAPLHTTRTRTHHMAHATPMRSNPSITPNQIKPSNCAPALSMAR